MPQTRLPSTSSGRSTTITAWACSIAGRIGSRSELRVLSMRGFAANSRVPVARWAISTSGAGPSATYGSFMCLDQLWIDPRVFGISIAEARSLDPQQNLVLCVGYDALRRGGDFALSADAATVRGALTNADIGVFVGVEASGLSARRQEANVFSASGGALSVTSGRLSYSLGLVGACYSIDTACASTLAALHTCVVTLDANGECESGVGVGTKVLSEVANMATSIGGMTSSCGRCHTFDLRADGYCRGEGCGAFLATTSRSSNGVAILGSAV